MNTVVSALHARVIRPAWGRLRNLRLQDGLEAVEYALIAALVSVVIVAAMAVFRPALEGIFQAISDQLTNAGTEINNTPGDAGGG
jgi:Flp pilus assembly pilin Flp